MTHPVKTAAAAIAFALCAASALQSAHAAEVLRASPLGPPGHLLNAQVLRGWSEAVARVTEGRVTIEVVPPSAPPPKLLDAVRNAVVDVAIVSNGALEQPPVLNALVEFAGQTRSAESASIAYQRVASRYPALLDEFAGVEVLALFTHGPGALLLAPPRALAAAGEPKTLHAGGAGAAAAVRAMGAKVAMAPGAGAKALLVNGSVDGTVTAIETLDGFDLAPQVERVVLLDGGFYSAGFSLLANKARWAALSAADRAAIASVSGETLAAAAGRAWDAADAAALRGARARGIVITNANDALARQIGEASEARAKAWAAGMGVQGIDAANALAEYRQEMRNPMPARAAP